MINTTTTKGLKYGSDADICGAWEIAEIFSKIPISGSK
jgi:hypothetical protein